MSYRGSPVWKLVDAIGSTLERHKLWYDRGTTAAIVILVGVRNILRRENLVDTGPDEVPATGRPQAPLPFEERFRTQRTPDGSWNVLDPRGRPSAERGAIGMAGTRFGRNVPLSAATRQPKPELLRPDPVDVAETLLARHGTFVPTTQLNALAAAWIQFVIRDWFSHGKGDKTRLWKLQGANGRVVEIPATVRDETRPVGPDWDAPVTSVNTQTHWWDGSQLYGVDARQQQTVRVDGRAALVADLRAAGQAMNARAGADDAAPAIKEPGIWTGLVLFYKLFADEHNRIVGRLRKAYPGWDDDRLFQTARLINAALLAKIHTVEWSTALLANRATQESLRGQWNGLAAPWVPRFLRHVAPLEELWPIPGSKQRDFGVTYALTEEFAAVYRMHPLVPDEWKFRDASGREVPRRLNELAGARAFEPLETFGLESVLRAFVTAPAGSLELHNFPDDLRNFRRPDDPPGRLPHDLAATDILRCRELGVPRYCEFRRALHLDVPTSFADLAENEDWAGEIEKVYDGRLEDVDLLVGLLAEKKPKGFAISDTAFRIFVVMAARRLKADRFFTRDYRKAVYTREGLEWIRTRGLKDVLACSAPGLTDTLAPLENPFGPLPD
jgi:hypothetical protein